MNKKLILSGLLLLTLNSFGQSLAPQTQFWLGTGNDTCYLVIDFKNGTSDSSYFWGYRFSAGETGEDLLLAVAAADPNLSLDMAGGFLNDVVYHRHEGLGGQPNYWSTWSGVDTASLVMNAGLATALVGGEWFALSYTDFNPALKPGWPIAAFDPATFSAQQVPKWFGTGQDTAIWVIDFQQAADSSRFTYGYLFNDSISAIQMMNDIATQEPNLTVNASGFLNDILLGSYQGLGANPNFWSTWSATNIGNWYMNAGINHQIKPGELFGCSYTDFAPALRPQTPLSQNPIDLEGFENSLALSIHPNPTADLINIQGEVSGNYSLLDAQGRVVVTDFFDGSAEIDLRDEPAGVYWLTFNSFTYQVLKK